MQAVILYVTKSQRYLGYMLLHISMNSPIGCRYCHFRLLGNYKKDITYVEREILTIYIINKQKTI